MKDKAEKALAWCKEHWKLLLGLAGGLILFLLGLSVGQRKPEPEKPAPGPSPKQKEQEQLAEKATQAAEKKHDVEVAVATKEHAAEVAAEVKTLEAKTKQIESDSAAVNETLLDVGKQVRAN